MVFPTILHSLNYQMDGVEASMSEEAVHYRLDDHEVTIRRDRPLGDVPEYEVALESSGGRAYVEKSGLDATAAAAVAVGFLSRPGLFEQHQLERGSE